MWKLNIQYPCENLRIGDKVTAKVNGSPQEEGNITNFIMCGDFLSCPHIPRPHFSIGENHYDTYHPSWIYIEIGSNLMRICSRCIHGKCYVEI